MNDLSARNVRLRDVLKTDLPLFFENQLDPTANHMAAFTAKNPGDRQAFDAHWSKIMSDENNTIKTIVSGETVIGSVSCFEHFGQTEVSYWLGKDYWGKGIATEALAQFLDHIRTRRPLYARAAQDNLASIRVLQKCGFQICGEDKGFSNARGREVEEFIFKKKSDPGQRVTRFLEAGYCFSKASLNPNTISTAPVTRSSQFCTFGDCSHLRR